MFARKARGPHHATIARLLSAARRSRRHAHRGGAQPPHLDGARLFAYWEGALESPARRAVEEHALCCDACLHWLLEVAGLFRRHSPQ
jgi:hypothetical protein